MLSKLQYQFPWKIEFNNEILKKFNNPDTYWVITWLGYCCWKDNRIQREVILTNMDNEKYTFNSFLKSVKIYIPEEQTFYFSLGKYLDHKGMLISESTSTQNISALQKLKVELDPEINYSTTDIYSKLKSSKFPVYEEEDDYIYDGAPHYLATQNGVEIIIPGHVILSYFYYLSTGSIYHIIYGTYHHCMNIKEIYLTNNLVPFFTYNSDFISYSQAIHIAKFKLMKDGYKSMANITADFFASLYRQKNILARAHITSKIPFNEKINFDVTGIMISENRFLVFCINRYILPSRSPFTCKKFEMRNISDYSALNNKKGKPALSTENIEVMNNDLSFKNKPPTIKFGDHGIPLKHNNERFYDIPFVSKQTPLEEINHNTGNNRVLQNINEIADNVRNHYKRPKSNTSKDNYFDFIDALFNAIDKLKTENVECDYIYMYSESDFNTYFSSINIPDIGLILVSIFCNNYNYCLIVNRNADGRMALLKCTQLDFRFKQEKDPIINKAIIYITNKYGGLLWSGVKRTQELEGLTVVHLFNHNKLNTFEDTAKAIYNKLKRELQI